MDETEIAEIWKQTSTEREIDMAHARADYQLACSEAERSFAERLASRVVAKIAPPVSP